MKSYCALRRVESCTRIVISYIARLFCLLGLVTLAWSTGAAVVGPAGYTNSFDTRPVVTDWSTKYVQGAQGDTYDLTNTVQGFAATNVNVQLVDGGTADPATARANAFWTAGGGGYVATRPAANRCTLLMVTLLNDTGTNAVRAHLGYDLGIKASSAEPDYPGLRAFYSLTGLSNSWAPIPEFSSATPVAGPLAVDLNFGLGVSWAHGSNLYVLWADDNANNPSGSIQDPAYALDNFAASVTGGRPAGQPISVNLTSPTNGAWFFGPETISLETDAVQDGTVARVEFLVDGAKVGEATESPYRLAWSQPPIGPHTVRAVITDIYASSQPSPLANIFVYDALGAPFVRITAPTNGTVFAWPTNIVLNAFASAWDGVTNVVYLTNGVVLGNATTSPYSVPWYAPFGSSDLTAVAFSVNGQPGTSAVANVFIQPPPTDLDPPTLVGQTPAAGSTLTTLTSIQVVFSELVTNVRAGDLLVNGVPARSVTGSVSNYTFTFAQPAYGEVVVTWATNHLITDNAYPALLPFDSTAPSARWTYTLIDRTGPSIFTRNPVAGAASLILTQAIIIFSEPVTGVEASDLLLNGIPATAMTGSGSNYTFFFDQPPLGTVAITWAANHGIIDSATPPNAFDASAPGATWSYTVGIPMQTGNDYFTNRIPLVGTPVAVMGSNVGTSTESGEPTGGGWFGYGNTVWWTWTAPASGTVRIDTFGSSFNTELGVFTGSSVNALTQIVLNDNAPGSSDVSLVTFTAVQGTEYQIQVSGAPVFAWPPVPPASGTIRLNLSMPPSITLLSPTNRAVYLLGQSIPLAATASVQSGAIQQVDFYCAGSLAASVAQAPFETLLANAPAGSNSVYAVVTDSSGQIATSAVVRILVANLGVTLTAPADGTIFANTNPISLATVTVLPAGAITNVAFLVDGEPFVEDNLAPFSAVWSTVSGGTHRLTAVGRADTGETFTSQTVYIGVAQTLVQSNSVWKYLDNGSDQGTAWRAPGFDDSTWASGPAELGYGDGDEATVVAGGPTNNFFATTYFRRSFVVSNAASFASLQINVQRDDGAVVYLNGVETGRYNMGAGEITYTNWASNANDDGVGFFAGSAPAGLLVEGTNVLAVELHQSSATSTDISFDLQMLGVPRIVRNESPTIALTSPTNSAVFLVPTDVTLAASAADRDGTLTRVEFFLDGTKLSEATNPPYALILQNVPAGTYTFTAAATDNMGATTVSAPVTIHVYEVGTRWVAYNDHYAGPGTHPNATAWNVLGTAGGAPGDEGALRNIATGAPLSAFLTLMEFGAFAEPVCGAPTPGTPAYDLFNGYVDFGSGGVNHAILVTHNSMVMHLFTGLNPLRRYRFHGTVVGGVEAYANRWTLCTIAGAQSYTAAHSGNVLTSATQPALAADEAAFNSGDNRAGAVVGWDNIVPGPDGSFMILSTQYLGPAPGNEQPGLAAYAPVAVRLEETGAMPFVRLTTPLDGEGITGPTNVLLGAAANALPGIASLSFLADGVLLGTTLGGVGSLVWTNPSFGDHVLRATTLDTDGQCSTSAPVTLHLLIPPTNTIAPLIIAQAPLAGSAVSNLTKVQVLFSEPVIGVDASDLLVNDVPATNVVGSGSNFLFSFVQPAYGPVRIRFAADHNITDVGWPIHLAFYENEPDNSWTYDLVDRTAPVIALKDPAAGSALTNLVQLTVTFSEAVSGVDAADLLVNGTAAYEVSGAGATYSFSVSQPASGTVNITWAPNHGIADQAVTPNPFNATGAGATWSYTLDAKTILVESNSSWLFVKGTNEASLPTNAWRLAGFDDQQWSNAPAPFFYGDPYSNGVPAYTLLSDMRSNYTSLYLRKTFVLPNAANITNLFLRAQSDDGFIAWINGVEVYRFNVTAGEIPYTGVASSASTEPQNNGAAYNTYTLPDPHGYLVSGTNVLAIQAVNESLSSSDFGFNAQLYTYQADTEVVAPRLVKKEPAPGYLLQLTNLLVTFSEPVTNLEAADLLVNGVPASTVTASSNTTFLFTFPQPAYGTVAITWAPNHGIEDLDISPKPFHEAAAGATWQYILLNPFSPYLVAETPVAGTVVNHLTQVTVLFSEPVTGVSASDLLVNGAPAVSVSGAGTDYTFTFAQPAYGAVAITWAADHGIQDLNVPPENFDPSWPTHTWNYTLVDQTPPAILAQDPPANASVLGLTQLTVTFTEPVTGVNATDLLLNGKAASGVSGTNETYTFTFAQPNGIRINVSWAADHGIRDKATLPNAFVAAAPNSSWSYTTTDSIPPTLVTLYPPPFATVRFLTNVTVTFDEPVRGLDSEDLLLNNVPAVSVSGSGAGPYTFVFPSPPTGQVQMAWAVGGDIMDFATPANYFAGGTWTYNLDPSITTDVAVKNVIHISLDGAGSVYLQSYLENAPSVFQNFSRLRREGAFTLNARCDYDISVTLPNHTGMFTGRPAQQPAGWDIFSYHGLTVDSDNGQTVHTAGNPNVPYKMSAFDVVHDHGLSTAFLYSKQSLTLFARSWNEENGTNDVIGEFNGNNKLDFVFNSTVSGSYGPTAPVVDEFVKRVETNGLWNYTFMHFDDGDATGHASGWGSTAYSNAILVADQQIGRVLTALQANPTYANRTIVIVTADHGGTGSGHNDATAAANYTVPIFLWGVGVPVGVDLYTLFANRANPGTARPSYTATPQPLRNNDTGNMALTFLGLPLIPGSSMIPLFGTPEPTTISLRLVNTGGSLVVSWPLKPSGYELQMASNLGRATNWTTLGADLIRTNGTVKEYDFRPAADAPASFFRLRKP